MFDKISPVAVWCGYNTNISPLLSTTANDGEKDFCNQSNMDLVSFSCLTVPLLSSTEIDHSDTSTNVQIRWGFKDNSEIILLASK